MLDLQALPDFDSAAREVLSFLHQRLGFDLWMITRTEGDNWIVLQARDDSYGIEEGSVFAWTDSFCAQMMLGNGPRIAPCSDAIPAYANAPVNEMLAIGSYIGVPLTYADGSLFGTLCAIDPQPQPNTITSELPLIELLAKLLSIVLNAGLKVAEQNRHTERVKAEALSDVMTGLYNRRGWNQLLTHEEKRCQQYGYPACIISIDLDGLKQVNDTQGHAQGDQLINRAGQALRQATRQHDVVARVGGDEFAVLGVECDRACGELLTMRIAQALMAIQVEASVGYAPREPGQGLLQTWEKADQLMYLDKKKRSELRL